MGGMGKGKGKGIGKMKGWFRDGMGWLGEGV